MRVEVPASPPVQVLGDAVMIRGAAAIDAYRFMTEGIESVRRRDGIEPPPRLLLTVAGLKAAAIAARSNVADIADIPDVRGGATSRTLRNGQLVGVDEVAGLFGIGLRQARRLGPSLGGWKKRSGEWVFDLGLVKAYIESEKSA